MILIITFYALLDRGREMVNDTEYGSLVGHKPAPLQFMVPALTSTGDHGTQKVMTFV